MPKRLQHRCHPVRRPLAQPNKGCSLQDDSGISAAGPQQCCSQQSRSDPFEGDGVLASPDGRCGRHLAEQLEELEQKQTRVLPKTEKEVEDVIYTTFCQESLLHCPVDLEAELCSVRKEVRGIPNHLGLGARTHQPVVDVRERSHTFHLDWRQSCCYTLGKNPGRQEMTEGEHSELIVAALREESSCAEAWALPSL